MGVHERERVLALVRSVALHIIANLSGEAEAVTVTERGPAGCQVVIKYTPSPDDDVGGPVEEPDDMPVWSARRRGPPPSDDYPDAIRAHFKSQPKHESWFSDIIQAVEAAGLSGRRAADYLRRMVESGEVEHPAARGLYRLRT
jgi:hypothetical protein